MGSTLSQLRTRTRQFMGVDDADPAYPTAMLDQFIVDAINAMDSDTPPDYTVLTATLVADTLVTGRVYSLATQSTPITNVKQIREVRLTDADGIELREIPYSERNMWGAPGYSVTGTGAAVVLTTTPATAAATPLFFVYTPWAGTVSDNAPLTVIPDQFHDVVALKAAMTAFAAGGESAPPGWLVTRMDDREQQWLLHVSMRTANVKLRRVSRYEAGP